MIVVDTSAVVAVLIGEADGPRYRAAIEAADRAIMSAVSVYESGMVLRARLGPGGIDDLYDLIAQLDIDIVPFGADDARSALSAFERYGKGIASKARLNLCDCVAYGLARNIDAPLLFKGDDFIETDIRPCL